MPVGTWPVYSPVGGFMPVNRRLQPDEAPVEVYVDLISAGSPKFGKDRAVLTLTASVRRQDRAGRAADLRGCGRARRHSADARK